jgi:ATP-dependent DNA helicase RecQ
VAVFDKKLHGLLMKERKRVAELSGVPPYAVFQESSIEDMLLKYPISIEELKSIHGVGEGKAMKFGISFVKLIEKYCEDNDVVRPQDIIIKSTGANSTLKLYIIQNIDRKLHSSLVAKWHYSTKLKKHDWIVSSCNLHTIRYILSSYCCSRFPNRSTNCAIIEENKIWQHHIICHDHSNFDDHIFWNCFLTATSNF